MTMLHIEKSEHCFTCKKTYNQHEYDMQYCTVCWSKNHRYPDFIDVRRVSEKPTGLEIVFGDVDSPVKRYYVITEIINKDDATILKLLNEVKETLGFCETDFKQFYGDDCHERSALGYIRKNIKEINEVLKGLDDE